MKTSEPHQSGDSASDLSHEEIAQRAYQLWEERGKTHGSDEEDWHRAQQELCLRSDAPLTSAQENPSDV